MKKAVKIHRFSSLEPYSSFPLMTSSKRQKLSIKHAQLSCITCLRIADRNYQSLNFGIGPYMKLLLLYYTFIYNIAFTFNQAKLKAISHGSTSTEFINVQRNRILLKFNPFIQCDKHIDIIQQALHKTNHRNYLPKEFIIHSIMNHLGQTVSLIHMNARILFANCENIKLFLRSICSKVTFHMIAIFQSDLS